MIVNSNGKILTVVDAPAEGDAFAHEYWWDFETMYLKSDCGVTAASQPSKLVGFGANPNCRSNEMEFRSWVKRNIIQGLLKLL